MADKSLTVELELIRRLDDWKGFAELYKRNGHYMVVSSVDALVTGPETLVFAADEDGKVNSWLEVYGARGGDSRAVVMEQMRTEEPLS